MSKNTVLKKYNDRTIIIHPWYIALNTQLKNVLVLSSLAFYKDLYRGGYFKAVFTSTSSSIINENTGKHVKIVEYPIISCALKILKETK